MKQPEKYFCDMCGTEITSTSGFINQRIPVVTECEWTEGNREPPHVDTLQMDLCKDCYLNAFNILCGYRGQNPRWRRKKMARAIDADILLEKLQRMIDYCKNDNQVNGLTALFQVGDAIMDCPTLTPPNEPLTLDELREMDGQPVWIGDEKTWGILQVWDDNNVDAVFLRPRGCIRVKSVIWKKIYRRPPEGGNT